MKALGMKITIITGLFVLGILLSGACEKMNNRVVPVEKNQLFNFLISLGEKHAFTPEALTSLTGLSLTDDPLPNKHFSVHYSLGNMAKEHPFIKKVELRSPVEKGNPGGLIILDLCNTSHITGKDVVKKFGEVSDLTIPSPEQPEEDPVFLVYKYDWGELGFGCSRDESDSLVSVVLDAYESTAFKEYKESNTTPGVFK
jgi:hypothetical protein